MPMAILQSFKAPVKSSVVATRDGAAEQRADEIWIQGKRLFVLGQCLLRRQCRL